MTNHQLKNTDHSRIPTLRFKEFEGEWEKVRLGALGQFRGGGTPSTSVEDYWNGSIPWISSSDIIEENIHQINITRYISEEAIKETATKLIPGKSILFVSRVGVGKLAISGSSLCTSQDFSNFTPSVDNCYFIGYFFLAKKNLLKQYSQGTSIKGFTSSDLKSIHLHLPSLPEQQKIAAFLSAVDLKIRQLTRKQELLEQYKKGVMQRLFPRKPGEMPELRFRDDNNEDFPDWEEKRLGEVAESIKSGKSKFSEEGEFPLFGSTGIIGTCSDFSHSGKYILIARVGANAGSIYIVDDRFGVSDNTLVVKCNLQVSVLYLYYKLSYQNLNRYVFGSGQPLITGGQLKKLKLNLPSLQEQQKIASFLSGIDEKIGKVGEQIFKTQEFKRGLLQQMFA